MKSVVILITASTLFLFGYLAGSTQQARISTETVLENEKVRVEERMMPAGAVREQHVRQEDQVIIFVNPARYERTDPENGEVTVRSREAGEVIWHSAGEVAPKLVNAGDQPFRSIIVFLKE